VISTCFLPVGVARDPDDFVWYVGAEGLAEQVGLARRWVLGLGYVNHDAAPSLLAMLLPGEGSGYGRKGIWITKTRKPAKNAKREDAKKVRPATNPFVFFALRALRPFHVFVIQTPHLIDLILQRGP
jgi:hypothetical protein